MDKGFPKHRIDVEETDVALRGEGSESLAWDLKCREYDGRTEVD